MKLKLIALSAVFAAGIFASIALADHGGHGTKLGDFCHPVHLSGTVAPLTLALTVDRAGPRSLVPAGTQLNLAVGSTGQTVRVGAEACATGTGSALVFTVKNVELRPVRPFPVTTTGQTTTGQTTTGQTTTQKHDEHHGRHEHGGTTTVPATTTTTATTTTAGTTTTHR